MSEVRLSSFRSAMAVIDAERESRKLSIPALAAMAGSAMNTLYVWRTGGRTANVDSLIRLAGALGFEIVMRPRDASRRRSPRHFLANVLELSEPITVDGQKVERLVFRRLKGGDLMRVRNPAWCGADLVAASTGLPIEAFESLCQQDREDATEVLAQMTEMVEAI